MRSDAVVTVSIRLQYPSQMGLAQDNHMIDALAPDRSDQPFGEAILPGRGWCCRFVPDAHGTQSECDDATIDRIAVTLLDPMNRKRLP